MSPEEKKSVIDRVPYFDKHSIVFDVGSNKGEFTDLLIKNASEVHLFEPNTDLITYTRVKYDSYKNVHYNHYACYSEDNEEVDFFYFTNENNGLSSIYHNTKWDSLPMKYGKVVTITIDSYCMLNKIDHIDFLKIDVEGAEFDVLLGCEKMLKERNIKYIQLEYSPHYKIPEYTFLEVIKYLNAFGYGVYSCDVEGLEWTAENFVEDYRLDNFIVRVMDITEEWNAEFRSNTQGMKFDFALEIGCFEGLTTSYICDNLLNDDGRVIAVDPLKDEYLTTGLREEDKKMNQELSSMFKGQYERFIKNTKGKPVELIRKTSRKAFPQLYDFLFDFIYIDGDHRREEVYNDAVESFDILKIGGHILFDDYEWRPETTEGINRFLNEYRGIAIVVVRGYQIMIQKKKEYEP